MTESGLVTTLFNISQPRKKQFQPLSSPWNESLDLETKVSNVASIAV